MQDHELELRFDPHTVEHLGSQMYSRLPNVIAELVANAYDADASEVSVTVTGPVREQIIIVHDDALGMISYLYSRVKALDESKPGTEDEAEVRGNPAAD